MTTNRFKLVILLQSPADRQSKYWLARSLGANPAHARCMRDWQEDKILHLFGLQEATMEKGDVANV